MLKLTAIALVALWPFAGWSQTAPLPDSIERCRIIAQEMTDYEDNTRIMFERFCEYLHQAPAAAVEPAPSVPAEPSPDAPDYFVKCIVDSDPDWVGFRLVTRGQCDQMQGRHMQAKRDFSPK